MAQAAASYQPPDGISPAHGRVPASRLREPRRCATAGQPDQCKSCPRIQQCARKQATRGRVERGLPTALALLTSVAWVLALPSEHSRHGLAMPRSASSAPATSRGGREPPPWPTL